MQPFDTIGEQCLVAVWPGRDWPTVPTGPDPLWTAEPATRDGMVRAYVVTIAPEVAGRIVELPVADNQFVHKGNLLMTIGPTDYRIAVSLAQATAQPAEANAQNAQREAQRRLKLSTDAVSVVDQQIHQTNTVVAQAQYQQALAWPVWSKRG